MQTPLLDKKPSEADKPPRNQIKMKKKILYRQTDTEQAKDILSQHVLGEQKKTSMEGKEGKEMK